MERAETLTSYLKFLFLFLFFKFNLNFIVGNIRYLGVNALSMGGTQTLGGCLQTLEMALPRPFLSVKE